ncbi:Alpha/Beta hydrolase protein [Macrophomina phaseolina]|uniref:Alpha/Beta hydrolase protein n=1 Tax=Macrophomina phaseolina TaxID=35725 RepID=A0ABQ8GMX1_9PEZI|nr:Alpha/Beta hydrolase protein [Macrophomina phaseolina]
MILTQISYLDCIIFLVFLAPQLLFNVGVLELVTWVLNALPHIVLLIPYQFIRERFFTAPADRSPFVQKATLFQDFVIRCVRYAFAFMPAYIGRVFFSKPVALPFLRWRMLRHGYLRSPITWREVKNESYPGIWLTFDEETKPDVVVFYCHGGGFSMGSSFFYMEFLLAWVSLLKEAGYNNPALFALEYTLVPDAVYPTQLQQAFAGYEHVLSVIEDPSRVCVGGDSAGGTLVLSLLLHLADHPRHRGKLPGLATMISPWVTIVSSQDRNTKSDYLNADSLHLYGRQYVGNKVSEDDPIVSPGKCKDLARWMRASPTHGWLFLFGSEEVLGPEIRDLIELLKKTDTHVNVEEEQGGIHAWPVAALYLGETGEERLKGLQDITKFIRQRLL